MKSETVGTPQSRKIGMAAILMVWLTAAINIPLSKDLLAHISTEELLIVRSVACIAVALALTRGRAWKSSPSVVVAGLAVGIGSITFYRALSLLGVDPVVCLMTFAPVVSLAFVFWEGKRPPFVTVFGILAVIGGTLWALEPWNNKLDPDGIKLAIVCIVTSAAGFELWGRAPDSATVSEKSFWLSAWVLILAPIIMHFVTLESHPEAYADSTVIKLLLEVVGFVTVYLFCSIVPYSRVGKMNVVAATALSQAGGPFVIFGAFLILGDRWLLHQCLGAGLAIAGAVFVSVETFRAKPLPSG